MDSLESTNLKKLVGLSLREPNFSYLKSHSPFGILEVIRENYDYHQGEKREELIEFSNLYSLHLHGVSLNIGGFDELDTASILAWKNLIKDTKPILVSDHLCFTRHNHKSSFDLLPFPFTKNMLLRITERIKRVEGILEHELVLENISTYFRYTMDEMREFEFLCELYEMSGVKYLLDLNNLLVNEYNHGTAAEEAIKALPPTAIAGFHLAGHSDQDTFYFDAHDSDVTMRVWNLFGMVVEKFGLLPTIIERDENIPAVEYQIEETNTVISILENYSARIKI